MRSLVALCCLSVAAAAQEDHSQHSHGPARLGNVNFANSCSPAVAAAFTRGVALLHSFGYEESRLAFREAAAADPNCAIAHWGVARTWYHPIWAPPSPDELKSGAEALARAQALNTGTPRERDIVASLGSFYNDWPNTPHAARVRAYEQALARLSQKYPQDDELAIFHALQVVAIGYLDAADKSYKWQKQGAEILNRLLPRHPEHPGIAHYIIHAVDYPSLAELGLSAARAYGKIAPDSPHALHMPSHIFTRVGLWDDSIESNIASARSAVAQTERLRGGRGGSFDELHACDYLVYAYLQEARDRSTQEVLAKMSAMTKLDENAFQAAYAFAASPARWALERHDWNAAAALELKPAWFPWDRFRNVEALVHYAKAIGAARGGDPGGARISAARMADIRDALPKTGDFDWSGSIAVQHEVAMALIAIAEAKPDGLRLLRAAADHEDAIDKNPVTPGSLLPAREMLAEILLEKGSASDALKEFERVLKTSPRRYNATAGAFQAAGKLGDRRQAHAYAAQLLEITKHAESERPEIQAARAALAAK
jgi:hypothetical protein